MDRQLLIGHRLSYDKHIKHSYLAHLLKLQSLHHVTDTTTPPFFPFLKTRLKQQEIANERKLQIFKENNSLSSRINRILTRKAPSCNNLIKHQDMPPFRKEEQRRISIENQKGKERIRRRQSQFSVQRWRQQRAKVEANINLISEYQYKNYKPSKSHCNLWAGEPSQQLALQRRSISNKEFEIRLMQSPTQYILEVQGNEERYFLSMSQKEGKKLLERFGDNPFSILNSVMLDKEKGQYFLKIIEEHN